MVPFTVEEENLICIDSSIKGEFYNIIRLLLKCWGFCLPYIYIQQ